MGSTSGTQQKYAKQRFRLGKAEIERQARGVLGLLCTNNYYYLSC
ncbi:MAG: hypothetical protein QHJ34_14845 [bacterium]|nr:hypothetical protein [candidate division KSB1 bacterium]MDH7561479.1 hypothetical protein [bacterium]